MLSSLATYISGLTSPLPGLVGPHVPLQILAGAPTVFRSVESPVIRRKMLPSLPSLRSTIESSALPPKYVPYRITGSITSGRA